MNMWVCR